MLFRLERAGQLDLEFGDVVNRSSLRVAIHPIRVIAPEWLAAAGSAIRKTARNSAGVAIMPPV